MKNRRFMILSITIMIIIQAVVYWGFFRENKMFSGVSGLTVYSQFSYYELKQVPESSIAGLEPIIGVAGRRLTGILNRAVYRQGNLVIQEQNSYLGILVFKDGTRKKLVVTGDGLYFKVLDTSGYFEVSIIDKPEWKRLLTGGGI